MNKLMEEIKQKAAFRSTEEEAFLNLLRTAALLEQQAAELLKPAAGTVSQYNALRILRGAGRHGLMCGEISARMLRKDPDVTRLLDRLEKRGLVRRLRSTRDRRVIRARITAAGLRCLADLDGQMAQLNVRQLCHLGEQNLRTLIQLLETVRSDGG